MIGRHRPNAVSSAREPPQPARVGDGRAGAAQFAAQPARCLSTHECQRGDRRLCASGSRRGRPRCVVDSRCRSLLCGLAAPAIARCISVRRWSPDACRCPRARSHCLRLVARRTWRFFETFVTADDHMLPPDNFQEDPQPVACAPDLTDESRPVSAVRRSARATSAGSGTIETVERLEATLATMQRMQRFRGHFYNWYDTRDLRPLDPRYVSSVDSGNLAAHLIAVANACREWVGAAAATPPPSPVSRTRCSSPARRC